MGNCGFSIIPAKLKSLYADSNEVYDWFSRIDFDEALNFYGLRNHKNFMALFSHFRDIIEQSIELKAVVWTLNNYLFLQSIMVGNIFWKEVFLICCRHLFSYQDMKTSNKHEKARL